MDKPRKSKPVDRGSFTALRHKESMSLPVTITFTITGTGTVTVVTVTVSVVAKTLTPTSVGIESGVGCVFNVDFR